MLVLELLLASITLPPTGLSAWANVSQVLNGISGVLIAIENITPINRIFCTSIFIVYIFRISILVVPSIIINKYKW